MKKKWLIVSVLLLLTFVILALPAMASPPDSATMRYGRPEVGSGCNFPCQDDASFHAVDKIAPGAVTISAGGTVFFDVEGFHQVAIYAPGKSPRDVEVDEAAFPFVNDPVGRIFLSLAPGLDSSFTFSEPGKYLVICNVAPHFEEAQMWGWVIVK